jgi:hypothetical protein
MNTTRTLIASSLVSVAALFAATGAVAQEVTPTGFEQFTSVASRADVQADAASALRAGRVDSGEATLWTAEAQRLGLVGHGELSAPSASPAQAELIRSAGLRALGVPVAQAAR